MKQNQETPKTNDTTKAGLLYTAFELGNSKWKLAFSDRNKVCYIRIGAGNLRQLHQEIDKAKMSLGAGGKGANTELLRSWMRRILVAPLCDELRGRESGGGFFGNTSDCVW